jgi:hypothetical protein
MIEECGVTPACRKWSEIRGKVIDDKRQTHIPASPDSDNLSFKLVRVKGKTYVIRHPGVCT